MPIVGAKGAQSSQGFGQFAQSTAATYIEDVFSTYLYTGNNSTQTITNGIDLAGKGGMVWTQGRTGSFASGGIIFDSERKGNTTGYGTYLTPFSTSANSTFYNSPQTAPIVGGGYTAASWLSYSGTNYVSWTFRKAPKFFDVVTWTGDGTSDRQIPHSLGIVPGCIIVKCTDDSTTYPWITYHRSTGIQMLQLYTTGAAGSSFQYVIGGFNPAANITSSYFTEFGGLLNGSGKTFVAYLFAHDPSADGIIQCGSYTRTNDLEINLGWEPQYILTKRSDGTSDWVIIDTMRGWTGGATSTTTNHANLLANTSAAETTGSQVPYLTVTSSGFKVAGYGDGAAWIYIAIRRGPMKTPTSGTSVYNAIARTGTGADVTVTGVGFVSDSAWITNRNLTTENRTTFDRLRGNDLNLSKNTTAAEGSFVDRLCKFDVSMDGVRIGTNNDQNSSPNTYVNHFFRRAPGFFDVATWTGTGAARTVSHNLVAVPELIIGKCINYPQEWYVYSAATGNSYSLQLQSNAAAVFSGIWNYQNPTVSSIYLASPGDGGVLNVSSRTYIGYLFASLQGISKVGNYTGNGSSQTINCGFTGGARFVLIKRTDSTGDWYVWDSARGIVAGNDPYLLLNSTAAEVTSTDYIDTYSAGFEISSTAPAAINANGGSFIFLAIA